MKIHRGRLKRLVFLFLAALALVLATSPARATSANANIFFPAMYSPYLSVDNSLTLQKWRWHTGLYLHYAKNPLEVGLAGLRRFGVIDHLLIGDFFGAIGITDAFQVGLSVPVAFYEDFNDVTTGTSSKGIHLSDVRFEMKYNILDPYLHKFGVSVLPFVFFPTGSGDQFVGNDSFAGGLKAIIDFQIQNRLRMALNLGYLVRSRVIVLNTEEDDQFLYGLGINVKTFRWLELIGEVHGNANATDLFGSQAETPVEFLGGTRFVLKDPEMFAVTTFGGVGLTFGYGSPDYRAGVSVTYPNPKSVDLAPPPPPPPPIEEKIELTQQIHFEFDQAVIRPISFPILDGVVDILKTNPDIRKVRVEGHTDSKGSDAYNMELSQRRAEAVREYLINKEIEADRLVAVGYGETRPLETNDTDEGRAKNRRIELIIIERN